MHLNPKLAANFLELVLPSFPHRLPKNRKFPAFLFSTNMSESEKVKGLRFSLSPSKITNLRGWDERVSKKNRGHPLKGTCQEKKIFLQKGVESIGDKPI